MYYYEIGPNGKVIEFTKTVFLSFRESIQLDTFGMFKLIPYKRNGLTCYKAVNPDGSLYSDFIQSRNPII